MSTKFVMTDRICAVEHKTVRQWVRGTGNDAEFRDDSMGWYAIFESCPASMFLGNAKPTLQAGDRVKLTMEKV